MKKLILIIIPFFVISSFSQEKTFLNEIFIAKKLDTIFLNEKYIIDYKIAEKNINKENFKLWWSFINDKDTPDTNLFFENFDLKKFRNELFSNKNDSIINTKSLHHNFSIINDNDIFNIKEQIKTEKNINYKSKSILSISKPIFNSTEDWAIIITELNNPSLNISSGGELNIYRKIKYEWILYHKFNLWVE
ncbi:hypothetical protein [Lacinutrix undariae]